MIEGRNYVPLPYNVVEGYAVGDNNIIPSGATAVGGYYYEWDAQGFTGKGWFLNIDGPMKNWGFESNIAVTDYINAYNNLNTVFSTWRNSLASLPDEEEMRIIDGFKNAVYNAGGISCVHY